jgi:opacity protein-like surface antigen
MIRKLKYILVMLLAVLALDSAAQNSQVMYYMNLPQNHMLNPALRPSNSVYIGLPVISGINLNLNNNFFNFSDVFIEGVVPDSLVTIFHPDYDPAEFMKKIKDVNSFETEALVQLFGLGFAAGKDLYIFLDVNERFDANIALPGDLIRLGFEGNEQFAGSKIDLSSLRGEVKYFREVGLGFSKNFTNDLRIGVRAKTLFGIAAASVENRDLGITVNDDYTHTFNADLNANFSAPLNIYLTGQNTVDSISFDDSKFDGAGNLIDYFLETKNLGFGIDIGVEYKITDKLKVSAAVTDLGYIKWKKDVTNLRAESEFTLSGIDLLQVYNGSMTFDSLSTMLLDTLMNSLYLTDSESAFTTYLPFGVTVGASYNLTKNFSVGLLSYTKFIGSQVREALTLSANVNIRNVFSTTIAYTAMNHRYDNLGFGIAFKPGWFQFYLLADRIPVSWNKLIIDGSTIPLPASWNTFHLRFGMNLAFGNRVEKKKDKPMIVVQ